MNNNPNQSQSNPGLPIPDRKPDVDKCVNPASIGPNEVFCTEDGRYPDAHLPNIKVIEDIGSAPYDVC